jgi:hypothetical protein
MEIATSAGAEGTTNKLCGSRGGRREHRVQRGDPRPSFGVRPNAAAQVDHDRPGASRFLRVAFGKLRRSGKERESHALERIFGDGFDDSGFAAGFGKRSSNDFLVNEANIDGWKIRLFQPQI